MEENKEEVVTTEVVEEKPVERFPQEGKIGFSNAPIYDKKAAKQHRKDFAKDRPDYKYRKWLRVLAWFGVSGGVLTSMYYFLPFFSVFIGGLLGFFIAIAFVFIVLITLGIIFASEGFRNWMHDDMWDVPQFFFNIANHIYELSKWFPAIAFPSLVLLIGGLVMAIIGKKKYKQFYGGYIALFIIFIVIVILCIIIYYASGGKTFIVDYE